MIRTLERESWTRPDSRPADSTILSGGGHPSARRTGQPPPPTSRKPKWWRRVRFTGRRGRWVRLAQRPAARAGSKMTTRTRSSRSSGFVPREPCPGDTGGRRRSSRARMFRQKSFPGNGMRRVWVRFALASPSRVPAPGAGGYARGGTVHGAGCGIVIVPRSTGASGSAGSTAGTSKAKLASRFARSCCIRTENE